MIIVDCDVTFYTKGLQQLARTYYSQGKRRRRWRESEHPCGTHIIVPVFISL